MLKKVGRCPECDGDLELTGHLNTSMLLDSNTGELSIEVFCSDCYYSGHENFSVEYLGGD